MGITCRMNNDKFVFEQTASRPLVYLDNWSFNLFLKDEKLTEKLCSKINDLGGTLTISIINILEITRRTDKQQIRKIAKFIDKMNGAFIEINYLKVIEREKELERLNIPLEIAKPWFDRDVFSAYILHAHDFLQEFKLSEAIICLMNEFMKGSMINDYFERDIYPLIEKARRDKQYLSQAKERYKKRLYKRTRSNQPYTDDLWRIAFDYVVINETMRMPDKEWRDLLQIIVPVAYCDYVLADGRWVNHIEVSGLKSPNIAKVYDRTKIEQFLKDLEEAAEMLAEK